MGQSYLLVAIETWGSSCGHTSKILTAMYARVCRLCEEVWRGYTGYSL